MEIIHPVLSKEAQDKLGVELVGFNVRIDYDDYSYKELHIEKIHDLTSEDFKEIEKEVQNLKNSDDYYHIDIYAQYKLVREDISVFNTNSFDRKSDDEVDFGFIYSEYANYRILTDKKPTEDIIYKEASTYFDNILTVNGFYDVDYINQTIERLEELKKHIK